MPLGFFCGDGVSNLFYLREGTIGGALPEASEPCPAALMSVSELVTVRTFPPVDTTQDVALFC